MKDGYYLAVYMHINTLSHLLDAQIRHDQNIALFHKKHNSIRLVRYWELERITGPLIKPLSL